MFRLYSRRKALVILRRGDIKSCDQFLPRNTLRPAQASRPEVGGQKVEATVETVFVDLLEELAFVGSAQHS
jgi:hypothetical protein